MGIEPTRLSVADFESRLAPLVLAFLINDQLLNIGIVPFVGPMQQTTTTPTAIAHVMLVPILTDSTSLDDRIRDI